MPEQHWLFVVQIAPICSHTVWQTPVLMLQTDVETQHTDDPGVQPWKSGTHAAASFAGESLAASCVVPASDVGL